MQKTVNICGFCPFMDEDVTIKATFTRYAPLGAIPTAKLLQNFCEYRDDCGLDPEENCPVSTQTLLWNEL